MTITKRTHHNGQKTDIPFHGWAGHTAAGEALAGPGWTCLIVKHNAMRTESVFTSSITTIKMSAQIITNCLLSQTNCKSEIALWWYSCVLVPRTK